MSYSLPGPPDLLQINDASPTATTTAKARALRQTREPISYAPPRYPELSYARPSSTSKKHKMKPTTKPSNKSTKPPPTKLKVVMAPRDPETTIVSHIPQTNVAVEIRQYPEFCPEMLPPLGALTLQPVHDSTAYIIESYVLPATRVSQRDGRLLPKELGFLIGWTDLPAARLVVPLSQILDYVSPFKYEEWEQEQERKREAVRLECLEAAKAADEALRLGMEEAAAAGLPVGENRQGRLSKQQNLEIGATLMAGSLLAPENLPEEEEEEEEQTTLHVSAQGFSLLSPSKRPMQVTKYPENDADEDGDELEEEIMYHQQLHYGVESASRPRASSLLAPPAPNSLVSSGYASESSTSITPKVGTPPRQLAARMRDDRWQQNTSAVPQHKSVQGGRRLLLTGPRPAKLAAGTKRKRDSSNNGQLRQTTLSAQFTPHYPVGTLSHKSVKLSAPSSSKTSRPSSSKTSRPSPSKASAPSPSKASAPSPSKASAPSPSKASAPSPSKASAPSPSKASAPSPSKMAASSTPKTTSTSKLILHQMSELSTPQIPIYAKPPTPTAPGNDDDDDDNELANDEYVVNCVARMDIRKYHGRPRRYFLIYWEGFDEPTWEPQVNMPKSLVDEFYVANPHLSLEAMWKGGGKPSRKLYPSNSYPSEERLGGDTTPTILTAKSAPTTMQKPASVKGKQTTLQWPLAGIKKPHSMLGVMQPDDEGGVGMSAAVEDEDGDELLVVE